MARGGSGSMEGRRTTLAEWWERWQSGRQISLLAARREHSAWRCWVAPHLGTVKLADLCRSTVQGWVAAQVQAGVAPSTIARHVGIRRACLSAAARDGLIAANPASQVQAPRAAALCGRLGAEASGHRGTGDGTCGDRRSSGRALCRRQHPTPCATPPSRSGFERVRACTRRAGGLGAGSTPS